LKATQTEEGPRKGKLRTTPKSLQFTIIQNLGLTIGPLGNLSQRVLVDSENITDSFKYLGSIISSDGFIDEDIDQRIKVGWMKWKQLSSVLCDRKVPVKTKGKVYKTAVRPALLYGSECCAPQKKHYTKLHTTEMRMLRWAGGITLMDKVQNKHIRGSMKVTPIEGKIKEARM
jgi:hypothetical protein